MPTLHVQLMGAFLLLSGDARITSVNSARLQSLLAYLVFHSNVQQSRMRLAFVLWPDSSESQAQANLRNLIFQLRRALPDADLFLSGDPRNLQWRDDAPYTLDVDRFRNLISQAGLGKQTQEVAGAESQAALEEAVELYKGDLLPGCYDEWVMLEREQLHQTMTRALERLVEILEMQRDYHRAIEYAQRLLRHDPLRETTYRNLMRLYALSGERAGALHTYHVCSTVLERELGVAPGPATHEAYRRLLSTEMNSSRAPMSPAPEIPALPEPAETPYSLVGRQAEWAQLQETWRSAAEGKPEVVLLVGEAGIGKTRLAEELVEWTSRQGIATAIARSYAVEGELAYAPITAWLRAHSLAPLAHAQHLQPLWMTEIARLLPELLVQIPALQPPGPLTEPWQRHRLHEAISRAILARADPLLLVLDDIQWCDRETIEFISYLLRFDPHARLLLVATLRAEELATLLGSPLGVLIATLQRSGHLVQIDLGPLDAAHTSSLASRLTGKHLADPTASRLYQETEGNPLFIVESVRAGLLELEVDAQSNARLPATVQSVITSRLAQLSAEARELVGVAAVIGREFSVDLLGRTSEFEENRVVRTLDELWNRRVVRERPGAGAYDFSHDKLREVAYASLGAARRRMLHRKTARALEAIAGGTDSASAQIAGHYERAEEFNRAALYYRQSADIARAIYANDEAIQHLHRALDMLKLAHKSDRDAALVADMAPQLHEALGELLELAGRHEEARLAYSTALDELSGVGSDSGLVRARILRKMGTTLRGQGRYVEAEQQYEAAEAALNPFDGSRSEHMQEWIEIQIARASMHYGRADADALAQVLERARPIVGAHGTAVQRNNLSYQMSQVIMRRERYVISAELIESGRRELEDALAIGDITQSASAHFRLAFKLLFHGDLQEAEEKLRTSLSLAEQVGDLVQQTLCLAYLAVIYRKMGRAGEVGRYADRALAIATRTQAPSYIAAARANLAWLALREGNTQAAIEKGSSALAQWEQTSYPFRWLALFPVIEIECAQERLADAIEHARVLFEPIQQRLPDRLTAALQDAISLWDQGIEAESRARLLDALELARQLLFL